MTGSVRNPQQEPSRRDFLQIAWAATGAAALVVGGGAALSFFAPRVVEGEFGGVFAVGAVDDFPVGSVTPVTSGRFYLVRQTDGGFLALYQKCTHLGCAVPWNPEAGRFICPCHASAFEMEGAVENPPAPRPLDRFPVTITDGVISVDTGTRIERDQISAADAVYA
ncbi:MAG: Rieske 2Fe-2S domain-containing protein [Anaerolineae bacterium]|nr:Rieske 2Fe-2S domain-containing protein [Anaerolineae bacterium]